jgi:hypothetical protein
VIHRASALLLGLKALDHGYDPVLYRRDDVVLLLTGK